MKSRDLPPQVFPLEYLVSNRAASNLDAGAVVVLDVVEGSYLCVGMVVDTHEDGLGFVVFDSGGMDIDHHLQMRMV